MRISILIKIYFMEIKLIVYNSWMCKCRSIFNGSTIHKLKLVAGNTISTDQNDTTKHGCFIIACTFYWLSLIYGVYISVDVNTELFTLTKKRLKVLNNMLQ
jgi:hypothetical protein